MLFLDAFARSIRSYKRVEDLGGAFPSPLGLILTHILQTEVKSKVNALKQRLQREPAFPDGAPARRAIMGACQVATQARHFRPRSVPTVMVRGD
jgi:hypothetical protein